MISPLAGDAIQHISKLNTTVMSLSDNIIPKQVLMIEFAYFWTSLTLIKNIHQRRTTLRCNES